MSSQLKFAGNFLDCLQRDTKIFLYHSFMGVLWVSLRSCHSVFIMFSCEGAPNSRQVSARSHEESLKFYFYPLSWLVNNKTKGLCHKKCLAAQVCRHYFTGGAQQWPEIHSMSAFADYLIIHFQFEFYCFYCWILFFYYFCLNVKHPYVKMSYKQVLCIQKINFLTWKHNRGSTIGVLKSPLPANIFFLIPLSWLFFFFESWSHLHFVASFLLEYWERH